MTPFYRFSVLALVALIIGFRSIWQLSRGMARPNLSFGSCAAMIIGLIVALSGGFLFHWPFAVVVALYVLTVYAGVLCLWSMTARQPSKSAS